MQTSLRYDSDSKSLRVHAKEKFPLASKIYCQVHGELDTGAGAPSRLALTVRTYFPELSASMGFGVGSDKDETIKFNLLGKKAFPITSNGLLSFNLKGRYYVDKENEKKARGAAELTWSILDFQRDQDLRLKLGYEVVDKVPYLQIRENNWTLNADINGRWNVRFDL